MWGLLNIYANYIKMAVCALLLAGAWYSGYHFEHTRFVKFQDDVRATANKQAEQTASIQKQHELVTKGIKDEYDAKLVTLRNYYKSTSVWNNNGSSTVPGISTTPKSADVIAAYNELAGNCAQTTLQLVELQKWINEQIGIK
jgi:hypothetical protein